MKRIAFAILLLSTPALAQQQAPSAEDTIAAQNQQIGQLYFQIGTLQQQINRANATIQQLQKAAQPAPAAATPTPADK